MQGFRRTLFLSHLALVALTLLLLAFAMRGLVERYFAEQLRGQLATHASFARRLVAPAMSEDGFLENLPQSARKKLQKGLRIYARDNDVRLRVISRDTQVLADTGPGSQSLETETASNGVTMRVLGGPDLSAQLDEGLDGRSLFDRAEVMLALQGDTNSLVRGTLRGGDMTMSFATPIRPHGEVIGCVLASAPVLRVTPALLGFIQRLGFTAAGIFILSVLVSGAIAQRLSAPARKLEEATRKLAAGDLSARVAMHRRLLGRGDEMDALTREFNRMAERLETTDEERRAFLADISHELRTPLCAIKGSAETLRDGAWRDEKVAPRFASTIATQSDRLIRLVGDLLKLARLEAISSDDEKRAKLNTRFDARVLASRVAGAMQPLFEERDVQLRVKCDLQNLRGDDDLLEQLLINLLANAARYSPRESVTTLEIFSENREAILRVTDEGRGIAPQHLEKLGQRFYRVEEGRERGAADEGSGLGLAICRRIALAHGGTLNIESEVGKGTMVTVRLPL